MSSPTVVSEHKVIIREAECTVLKKGATAKRALGLEDLRKINPTLTDEVLLMSPLYGDDTAIISITWNQQPNDIDRCIEIPWNVQNIDALKQEMVGKPKYGGAEGRTEYSFKFKASLAFLFLQNRLPLGAVLDLGASDGKDQPCD